MRLLIDVDTGMIIIAQRARTQVDSILAISYLAALAVQRKGDFDQSNPFD